KEIKSLEECMVIEEVVEVVDIGAVIVTKN
ncbi:hypothetical protein A2U01_0107031, partial [Trifolium medium]|nr:hypothetical protein [Trifolium medium]